MGQEIDLLAKYPRPNRDTAGRASQKSEEHRAIARRFDREFFDGDRSTGYGGFSYHPRFWEPVIPDIVAHFGLSSSSSLLDVGCAKGFMLFDLMRAVPGISVAGVDVSEYAIGAAKPEIRDVLQVADAMNLPFDDDSFDVVISINTIHNLDLDGCFQALKEIQRVCRRGAFVTVDAYRTDEEHKRMMDWNLTARTILSTDEWVRMFEQVGYRGDYYWFIP